MNLCIPTTALSVVIYHTFAALTLNSPWDPSYSRKSELLSFISKEIIFENFALYGDSVFAIGVARRGGYGYTHFKLYLATPTNSVLIRKLETKYNTNWDEIVVKREVEKHVGILQSYWDNVIRKFCYGESSNRNATFIGNWDGIITKIQNPNLQPAPPTVKGSSVLDIIPSLNTIGLASYKNKFGVIIKYNEIFNPNVYGFVACALTKPPQSVDEEQSPYKLLIVGYGPKVLDEESARRAWGAYNNDQDKFGQIVPLTKFCSGEEGQAIDFYKNDNVQTAITNKINSTRCTGSEIEFLNRGWIINKGNKPYVIGTFKLKMTRCPDRHFFVAFKKEDAAKNRFTEIVIGSFYKDNYSMMQNLSDYVEETYILEPIEKEYNPDSIDDLKITSSLQGSRAVDALIYVADFTARALALSNRNDADMTPLINKALAILVNLVNQFEIEDPPTLCAALLSTTVRENITLSVIEDHFGPKVKEIVAGFLSNRSEAKNVFELGLVENLKNFFEDLAKESNPTEAYFEGSYIMARKTNKTKVAERFKHSPATQLGASWPNVKEMIMNISSRNPTTNDGNVEGKYLLSNVFQGNVPVQPATLHQIWKARRNKLSKVITKTVYTDEFKITFLRACNIGKIDYGIYKLTEMVGEVEGQVFHFTVEYNAGTQDYIKQVGIVGELRKSTSEIIIKQMLEDYADAKLFSGKNLKIKN